MLVVGKEQCCLDERLSARPATYTPARCRGVVARPSRILQPGLRSLGFSLGVWVAADLIVAGLNRELPSRVQKLQELQGDKLRK